MERIQFKVFAREFEIIISNNNDNDNDNDNDNNNNYYYYYYCYYYFKCYLIVLIIHTLCFDTMIILSYVTGAALFNVCVKIFYFQHN